MGEGKGGREKGSELALRGTPAPPGTAYRDPRQSAADHTATDRRRGESRARVGDARTCVCNAPALPMQVKTGGNPAIARDHDTTSG